MFAPFILFLVDFIFFMFFDQWLVYCLLIYFIYLQSKNVDESTYFYYVFSPFISRSFNMCLFLLLLQSNFLYSRFGLNLVYLFPIIFFSYKLRTWFNLEVKFFYFLMIIFALFGELFVIKYALFGQNIYLYSTITKIFINLTIGYLILLGTRSNRPFLSFSQKQGGKSGLITGQTPYETIFNKIYQVREVKAYGKCHRK